MAKRVGKRTVELEKKISFVGYGSVVGKREHEGPLGAEFENYDIDCRFGEDSYEKAESRLQKIAVQTALKKCGLNETQIDCIFAGDLLNQCIGSFFGLREMEIPLVGMYGACSTMTLALINAANLIECGGADITAAVTSSHFCSAERQYRFPLEYGCQRTPTAQRTVTGSGASILKESEKLPYIHSYTIGKIVDLGVTDANNMGAAMAPAAADTLKCFFRDTATSPDDYDAIFTGDLGRVGSDLLYDLLEKEGINIRGKHRDCGLMIFDTDAQDVHAGGSGCGCSASVLNSYVMERLSNREYNNILFMSTGALLSTTSSLQGESIPSIAHLINIRNDEKQ